MQNKEIYLINKEDLKSFATDFFKKMDGLPRCVIFLYGDLGAGKTTFTQAVLWAAGFTGKVKSPTYSLCESYQIGDKTTVHHLDLYRLQSMDDIYFSGLNDTLQEKAWFFIEWPERLQRQLVAPDIEIFLEIDPQNPDARKLGLHIL